jgi:hypothetical protein
MAATPALTRSTVPGLMGWAASAQQIIRALLLDIEVKGCANVHQQLFGIGQGVTVLLAPHGGANRPGTLKRFSLHA